MNRVLLAIYLSPTPGGAMQSVPQAKLFAERGLEGDRYAVGLGTFSPRGGKHDVTLIEAEALKHFAHEYACTIDPAQSRRNLLTRGVRLNDLVDREFSVGSVSLRGLRLCEPCAHLARLTKLPVLPGLIRRGGLYAEILNDGSVAVGDAIRL